jgi:16S rRNA (guanine966-N2)-methyltransferase
MAKRIAKAAQKNQPGRLRIVAGNWRSRLLDIADVPGLRPTSERVRETLFNWLAPRIARARVLDLFAGTGALGLEALSRGAAEAVFVESSAVAVAMLRKNVAALEACSAQINNTDAFDYLQRSTDAPFDVVFLDPPFAADNLDELCRLLAKSSLLAANAWVYLEEDRVRVPVTLPDGWRRLKTKQAGNVRYSLVEAAADA